MFDCSEECGAFDTPCFDVCTALYIDELQKCPCMSGCLDGCPCPDYPCHDDDYVEQHEDIHLLIFNPKINSAAKPTSAQIKWSLIKQENGKYAQSHSNVELATPDSFEGDRSYMCSFTNHGNMYMAGGPADKSHRRRLFQVKSDEIVQLANMPFDFAMGQCVGNLGEHGYVLFCFGILILLKLNESVESVREKLIFKIPF